MFIGRKYELNLIKNQLKKEQAQLIIVYGRRRVGKTSLIKESIKRQKNILFFEGVEGEDSKYQINRFLEDFARQTGMAKFSASTWNEVFNVIEVVISKGKWTLVFNGNLSFDDAVDASVQTHKKVFPKSGCKSSCICAQIKESLKKCKDSKINPASKIPKKPLKFLQNQQSF